MFFRHGSLPLKLTELGGRKRVFVFAGPDLPRDASGWPWLGGAVTGARHYYPGSPDPTVQILGTQESEITFSGKFEDRKKGIAGWAEQQSQALDDLRAAARPVRFEYGPWTRDCLWVEAKFQLEERARIPYVVTLTIIGRGEGQVVRVFSGIRQIPLVSDIVTAAQTVAATLDQIPGVAGSGALQRARGAVQTAVSGLSTCDVILRGMQENGVDTGKALSALTSLDGAKQAAADAWAHLSSLQWSQVPGAVFDAVTGPGLLIASAVTGVVGVAQSIAGVRPAVAGVAGQALSSLVYIAAAGETLQKIAARYYGTASAWPKIAQANGLADPTVQAGQKLILPDVPQADRTAR